MAAPHVAGIAALYLTKFPTATPAQVHAAIVDEASNTPVIGAGTGSPEKIARIPGSISAGAYTPITPKRVLDTRNGTGFIRGPIEANQQHFVALGEPEVPEGVTSVVLNLTVTAAATSGWAVVQPARMTPKTSSINFAAGETRGALVTTPVDGRPVAVLQSSTKAHFIIDVVGYTGGFSSGGFSLTTPTRILDSRNGNGGFNTPWAANATRGIQVTGKAGIPTNASAVVGNLTVASPTSSGHAIVWPTGSARPTASAINWAAATNVGNGQILKLGAGGKIDLANISGGTAHFIFDVTGYVIDGEARLGMYPTGPARVLDSRNGTGGFTTAWPANGTRSIKVAGVAGVPTDAKAAVVNIAAVAPAATGYTQAWAAGQTKPITSILNFYANRTLNNLAVVPIGTGGNISIANVAPGNVHYVVDITGYLK